MGFTQYGDNFLMERRRQGNYETLTHIFLHIRRTTRTYIYVSLCLRILCEFPGVIATLATSRIVVCVRNAITLFSITVKIKLVKRKKTTQTTTLGTHVCTQNLFQRITPRSKASETKLLSKSINFATNSLPLSVNSKNL